MLFEIKSSYQKLSLKTSIYNFLNSVNAKKIVNNIYFKFII